MRLSEFVTALRSMGRRSDRTGSGGRSDKAAEYLRSIRESSAENDTEQKTRKTSAEIWRISIERFADKEIITRGGKPLKNAVFERSLERVSEWAHGRRRPWLMLTGTIGTGKSTLARAAAAAVSGMEGLGGYVQMMATATNWMKPEDFAAYTRAAVLVIDDLGCEQSDIKLYGNTVSPMAEIICERYDRMRTTIFTTNELASDIKKIYGDRIADRMREMCEVVKMEGDSFRKGGAR